MKIKATKIEKLYLHLEFRSRADRDKIYDYIMEMIK